MTSIPSLNVTPRTSFGNWLVPSRRRQLFCAASSSLKTIASAVRLDRHPFDRMVRWRTVAKVLSMGLVVRRCFPVLGGEFVERQQRISILAQAVGGFLVFGRVALDEGVERQFGGGLGFGHPDFLQRAFGLRLLALWQLGEHVGGLVYPAALLARFRPDLTGGLPEPERAIGDDELRGHVEPAPPQIEQQIAPIVRALPGAIGEADQFLAAFRRRADQHED